MLHVTVSIIHHILVYSNKSSNRLVYTLNTVFGNLMGLSYTITTDIEEFKRHNDAKLNYSALAMSNAINIVPHGILFDYGIKDYLIEVHTGEEYGKFFFKNNNSDCAFDLLGATFWLISRYEEYLPFKANKYNVFDYRSSVAWQNNFLDIPLVNIWCNAFKKNLLNKFPTLVFKHKFFKAITTIDIDNVYKYKHKGFFRTIAGVVNDLKSGNVRQLKSRIETVFFNRRDEFDCYNFLIETNKNFNADVIYFFLLGDYGVNDKNHPSSNLHFQKLMKHLADYSVCGIHPSFASNYNSKQLKVEIVRLSSITHKDIINSRQHFGMLQFPKTYTELILAGIKNDYSLGYTTINGFRASICNSYKWYNIANEEETSLVLHPFCLTDAALEKEAKLSSQPIIDMVEAYANKVNTVNGEFITVFHNDMLANTPNGLIWRGIYQSLLKIVSELGGK